MTSTRTMLLAALALAALLAAGCGTKTLKGGEIEGFVEKTAKEQGAKVTSVDCPDDVKAEKGKSFTCKVKGAGGKEADINVEQTSNHGNVSIGRQDFIPLLGGGKAPVAKPLSGLPLNVSGVEQAITKEVSSKSNGAVKAASVDCPSRVVVKRGATFTCEVTSDKGKTTKFKVTQTDAQGNVRFKGDLRPLAP